METPHRTSTPDVSAEQLACNEKIKLIRKPRWMGMEAEAVRLQVALADAAARADSVIAEPGETN
ncbi:MAG TPA: hypothetical protein VNL39_01160 [Xanthobacteraceae bacterium]|nr:hypothetical protein [Xanthobacteraceae bacterium]